MPRRRQTQKKPAKVRKARFFRLGTLLLLLLGSLCTLFYFVFLRTSPEAIDQRDLPAEQRPAGQADHESSPPSASGKSGAAEGAKPLVAIIIDDMGYHRQVGEAMLALPLDLTFSFLPGGPHTAEQARKAQRLGRDVLLHLPMEPTDSKWDPGPGALFRRMAPELISQRFEEALAAVPMAIGLNNHMGSRFTQDRGAMSNLLLAVKPRSLFFVDSLTVAGSVGGRTAVELGIRTAKRDIFLDNEQEVRKITAQLDRLLHKARQKGAAIGIGHPYPATLQALTAYQSQLKKGAVLVGVHHLVR